MTILEYTAIDGTVCRGTIPPHHYSDHPDEAVFFYGGWGSNFVGGPFKITSHQPWSGGARITLDYYHTEGFFAASKALTREAHEKISFIQDPWRAKDAGRKTPLREDWEDLGGKPFMPIKYHVMMRGLRVKFAEPEFRDALLATGNRYIAEDSPTDAVWGIDAKYNYSGTNLLGKALMNHRAELRQPPHVFACTR